MLTKLKQIAGILLLLLAFVGVLFFRHYTGSIIPYPSLFYLVCLALGICGAWILYSAESGQHTKAVNNWLAAKNDFKLKAEKIKLDIDQCEFRSGTFTHEVRDTNMELVKVIAPIHFHGAEFTKMETVVKSYLLYRPAVSGPVSCYFSNSFPVDTKTLEYYVLTNKIALFVNRFNREQYLFDIDE